MFLICFLINKLAILGKVLIKFLASSHSSYITGETIHVDGGLLI